MATFGLLGIGLGSRPITDNSMLLHLRTGLEIARGLGIPRRDPYTYTAGGERWVVQSWLPELTYGWLQRLGGGWVVVEQAVLLGALAWLMARLASAGTPTRTLVAAGIAVGVGASTWDPRPLLFGLVLFAVLVTVVEAGMSPWWLLPVGWVWVNSHGSFPLAVVWLATRLVGEWLDRRSRLTALPSLRPAMLLVAGMLLGGIASPIGPSLLTFPLTIAGKASSFRNVVEWQSPALDERANWLVLVSLVASVLVLVSARRRVPWTHALPCTAFLGLALSAQRNLGPLAIVLAPALGHALAPSRGANPSQKEVSAPRTGGFVTALLAGVLAALALVFFITAAAGPAVSTRAYPEAAATWLDEHGYLEADRRVAHPDLVGNYLEYRYGRNVKVFIDDRVDMFPTCVVEDALTLLRARAGALDVLDRWKVDAVVWGKDAGPVELLRESEHWRQAFADRRWVVFVRTSARPAAEMGRAAYSAGDQNGRCS